MFERERVSLLLAACGAVGALALAGCGMGSSGSSGAAPASPGHGAAGAGASGAALPSWASALGAGVTVSAASQVGPGNDSPAAAVQGEISALAAKDFKALCAYQEPAVQAKCNSQAGQAASLKDQLPYTVNPGLGYVVTDGTKALVGTTGKFCVPGQSPECFTNTDPAAVFSSGKSFASLWTSAVAAGSTTYSPTPCVKIAGKWYIYSASQ
jgi:hypothetical protein